MSDVLIAFITAAGVGAFVYSKMGPRLGYGNVKNVWILVGVCFALVFLFMVTLLKYVIHLH